MLTIDLNRPEPIEDQLCRGIHLALAKGQVKPGDELPSVRQLAGDLGIHWNTVARAYRRLRDEGLLAVGRGRSVRVTSAVARESREPERDEKVELLIDSVFTRAKLLGMTYPELRATIERSLEQWRGAWEEGSS